MATPVQNMGINHRGFHVFVTEQFLDGSNVPANLKQASRERQKARRPPGKASEYLVRQRLCRKWARSYAYPGSIRTSPLRA